MAFFSNFLIYRALFLRGLFNARRFRSKADITATKRAAASTAAYRGKITAYRAIFRHFKDKGGIFRGYSGVNSRAIFMVGTTWLKNGLQWLALLFLSPFFSTAALFESLRILLMLETGQHHHYPKMLHRWGS
tara:strand:+ start:4103 stop:4498 length:396 start_codon:yes stop_codon:yes gene_type:complete